MLKRGEGADGQGALPRCIMVCYRWPNDLHRAAAQGLAVSKDKEEGRHAPQSTGTSYG